MTAASRQLETGAHVTLDGVPEMYAIAARRMDAAMPSGVAFWLMPDAGGWVCADRVAYATGFGEEDRELFDELGDCEVDDEAEDEDEGEDER